MRLTETIFGFLEDDIAILSKHSDEWYNIMEEIAEVKDYNDEEMRRLLFDEFFIKTGLYLEDMTDSFEES